MITEHTPKPPPASARWGALRHRDFRLLWAARTVSAAGERIGLIAIPTTAILVLGATPAQVGILNAFGFIAWPVLGLAAGVWVDRLRRRPVMIAGDFMRAALLASIPLAFLLHRLTYIHLVAVMLVFGILSMLFDLAVSAHTPVVVPPADRADANAKVEIASQALYALGPGLGGALIGLVGAPLALVVNALTYAGSGALITGMSGAEAAKQPRRPIYHEVAEGLRFMVERPALIRIAIGAAVSNVGLLAGQAVQLLYFYRVLHISPLIVGVCFGFGALGALAGASQSARLMERLGIHRTLVISTGLEGLFLLLLPAGRETSAPLVLVVAGLVGGGFAGTVWNVSVTTFRQAVIPSELIGRVSGAGRVIGYGALPVGALLGGFTGQFLSNRLGEPAGLTMTLALAALLAASSALTMVARRGFTAPAVGSASA